MRLKMKLLLLLVLCFVCVNSKCFKKIFGGGDTCANRCCINCIVGETYDVIYNSLICPKEIDNVQCFAGTINVAQDCEGTCNIRLDQHHFFGFSFTASPAQADLNNLPSSLTFSGQAIDATYGMPRVSYFTSDGYLVGSTIATQVAGDGSWLAAPLPDLSQAWTGTYQVQIANKTSLGSYTDILGTASLSCWGRDRPDSDGDGYYDDEDCYPEDPYLWDCFSDNGGGGGGDDTCGSERVCYVY